MWSGGLGLVAFQVFVEMSWAIWGDGALDNIPDWILFFGIIWSVKAQSTLLVWQTFIKEYPTPA